MTLTDQLRAAGLKRADLTRLSQGMLSASKLEKADTGERPLSPEDRMLANHIIAEYRMMTEKVKWVVFESVGKPVG